MASKARHDFLQLAKARFKQATEADQQQRARELKALKFYSGDQWPEDIKTARAGQAAGAGLPAVPARPCLVIDKIREPIRQVLNQERQSDMGSSLVPADDFESVTGPIDHEEIQLREGLLRRIQRQSHAADARTWAFDRAVKAGRGYYGITTKYADGKTFDQEIVFRRFYNQDQVVLDPAHEQPDGSDAEWAFIGCWLPYAVYKSEYGERNGKKNRLANIDTEGDWARFVEAGGKGWFRGETGKPETRAVLVVEYFYTVRTSTEIALVEIADGQGGVQLRTLDAKEVPEGFPVVERRKYVEKQIKWAKIDGCDDDVLEETDWAGRYIPIIKVSGEELQPYDEQRRYQGMVEPAEGSQLGFNYLISGLLETIALNPKAPFIGVGGQFEGYETAWNQANVRNWPYLEYNAYVENQGPFPPPQRSQTDPGAIQALAIALREFDSAIRATTGGAVGLADPSVGGVDPALRSGKAITRLLHERQMGTSNFMDNLKRAIHYEALIINDLLEPIYGRTGRLVRILNHQQEPEAALIDTPFVMQGGPNGASRPVPAPTDPTAKRLKLSKNAVFNVAVKVSRDFDTRRQEEGTMAGELIAAQPQLMSVVGDIFFKNQDWPGSQEMADRMKVMLAPPVQMLIGQTEKIPPAAMTQIAQLQQQLQGTTQMAQQLYEEQQAKKVEADRAAQLEAEKQAAETERARLDHEAKIRIAEIQANTQFGVAEIKAGLDTFKLRLAHIEELLGHQAEAAQLEAEQAHDADQLERNRQVELANADADRQVQSREGAENRRLQRDEGAAGRAFEADQAERGRQQEQQLAREQAQQRPQA